jgi:phenylpropionate dioxygenase-like ring-hydroxylating dioxygenase large terminal subunit
LLLSGTGDFLGWIAVGLSADLLPSMAMPGRVLGTDLAIWRAASGQLHIWGDRCPHRGMRLSHGFVRGETLSCIYHGWQYAADGGCSHIPAHPALIPPKSICATTYACAEQDGVIWVTLQPVLQLPPSFPGQIAIRSMAVHTSAATVAAHFDSGDTSVLQVGPANSITLLLQPVDADRCMIHALSDRTADRKAVSRWLDGQRQGLEMVPA